MTTRSSRWWAGILLIGIAALASGAEKAAERGAKNASAPDLDGVWQGRVTSDSPQSGFDGKIIRVKLRVTSSGHAIVHEMREAGVPETPDHMGDITILYLDGEHLMAQHFCDADNRPLMEAIASPDPTTIKFDLIGINGNLQLGYIHDVGLKAIAPGHHTEDWTYIFSGNRSVHVHFDLERVKS